MECFLYLARKTVNSEPKVVSCLLCASPIHAQNRHNFRLERMKRGERKKGNPLNDPDRKGSSAAADDDDDEMPEIMSRRALLVWRPRVLSFKMGICPEAT